MYEVCRFQLGRFQRFGKVFGVRKFKVEELGLRDRV